MEKKEPNKNDKQHRLSQALRKNILKRKEQTQARKEDSKEK